MAFSVVAGFDVTSIEPIDRRTVIATSASLSSSLPIFVRYNGLTVYVQDIDTVYRLVGGVTEGNWRVVSSASVVPSASYAVTASYAVNSSFSIASGSTLNITASSATSSSYAMSSSYALQSAAVRISSSNLPQDYYALFGIASTGQVFYDPDGTFNYNPGTNLLTITNISASTMNGTLVGTASQAISASYALAALSASYATTTSYYSYYNVTQSLTIVSSASFASSSLSSSWATNAVSSSYALSSSYSVYRAITTNLPGNTTTSIFSQTSSIYNSIFVNYVLTDAANFRAGNIVVLYTTASTVLTEVCTRDIGTTQVSFDAELSASFVNVKAMNADPQTYSLRYHLEVL
jgi:hypothetical protein